ncbi:AEC family transporter [Reinekea sp. G2M2-21]|uniref:AEC family transporter n=1 Tax=Reinekea sp. G2M2-21 TaxID=2788942 RepID=UPI0018A9D951|nr:AEC family transporter [Reinekea sp. G2M2-21]
MENIHILVAPVIVAFGWIINSKPQILVASRVIGLITFKVLLPSLLFKNIYLKGVSLDSSVAILLCYYIPVFVLFICIALITRTHSMFSVAPLSGVYSNTLMVGIPVIALQFGENYIGHAMAIVSVHSMLLFTAYYFLRARRASTVVSLKDILLVLRDTAKNPIIFSIIIALVAFYTDYEIDNRIMFTISIFSYISVPCALYMLGASLRKAPITSKNYLFISIATKLFALPMLVSILCIYVFKLSFDVCVVLIVLASCPTGINVNTISADDNFSASFSSSAIVYSTLLSFLSIPLWLLFIELNFRT